MASTRPTKSFYPDELNPFDDEDDDRLPQTSKSSNHAKQSYPEQLNPFDSDGCENDNELNDPDDYDNSFNPFTAENTSIDDEGTLERRLRISKNAHNQRPQSSLSKIDYNSSLNPFDEDEEEDTTVDETKFHNRKEHQRSRYSSGYSSSTIPTNQSEDGPNSFNKSLASQPPNVVNDPSRDPRRPSPAKRPKKRAAPKPPLERTAAINKSQLSPSTTHNCEEKSIQHSITSNSDDNPSLSYSSFQSMSSPSPVMRETQQVSCITDEQNDLPDQITDNSLHNEDIKSSVGTLIDSNSQLSQATSHYPELPAKPLSFRVPSPAIRRSLNSMSSMNHSFSSISSQKEPLPTLPSCRSHNSSMINISDDFKPKPLPRTKSLLRRENRLSPNISTPPPQDLKAKLENMDSELTVDGSIENDASKREDIASVKSQIQTKTIDDTQSIIARDGAISKDAEVDLPNGNTQSIIAQDGAISKDADVDSTNENGYLSISTEHPSSTEKYSSLEDNEDNQDGTKGNNKNSINGSMKSLEGHDDRNAALWRKIGLKKRAAPPLPVNFKRQVFGSLMEIEVELNEIGDSLVDIEKRFVECRMEMLDERLKTNDSSNILIHRTKFIDLVKEKCDLARRQKDLMYRKREHILDQSHSDIEYELRMIGNKQASHRTDQDDQREQVLLKRLVEIIEEKNDIVENLIKDNSISDEDELNEALKRLDIRLPVSENFLGQPEVSVNDCDRKTTASKIVQTSSGGTLQQDKIKTKHRPSTAKAFKTLRKYGKVVVKMSKKEPHEKVKSNTTSL